MPSWGWISLGFGVIVACVLLIVLWSFLAVRGEGK